MSKFLRRRPWTDWVDRSKAAKWVSGIVDRLTAADQESSEKENVLLQSYVTSLLSLVLCVGMFLGTSYAWFTSEVSNTSNEIYIGILEVEMEKQDKQNADTWLSLSETNAEGNTTTLFDGTIRWEPGCTAMETIRVTNKGDLAFSYVLHFTDGSVTAPAGVENENARSLKDVAQYFDVWVYDHGTEDYAAPTAYAQITAENSGWKNAGTLDKILGGEIVLNGAMDAKPITAQQTEIPAHTYTIALHMNDGADASVMGYKISLSVKLIAYQKSGESDAFDNDSYDANITAVTALEDLREKLAAGNANLLLGTNMEIDDAENRLTMNGGILDGYSKTISYTVAKGEDDPSLGVVTVSGGTVRNLTIDGGTAGRALYSEKLTADLLVSNCVLDGVYAFNLNSAEETEYTMRFVNTTFKSWTSYANAMKCAEFAGCTFENVLRPYGNTVLTNCTFTAAAALDVSRLEAGETIELVNCTIGEATGIDAVLKATSTGIAVESGDDLIAVSDGKIVPRS